MSSHHTKRDTFSRTSSSHEIAPSKSVSSLQKQQKSNVSPTSGGSAVAASLSGKVLSTTENNSAGLSQNNTNGSGSGVSAFSYLKAKLFGTVADTSTSLTSSARELLQSKKNAESTKGLLSPELSFNGKTSMHGNDVLSSDIDSSVSTAAPAPTDPPLSPTATHRLFSRTLPGRRQPQPEPMQFTPGKQVKTVSPTGHPAVSASESLPPSVSAAASSRTHIPSPTSTIQGAGHGRRESSAVQQFTNAQKHLSTGSLIYQEGYLNKKVDLHSGETGHGWKVYRVALKSSKLYFYKPLANDERPQFHSPKDHRHYPSPNHPLRDHQGYHHTQHSSSSGIISPQFSISNECGMVLSAFNFESSTRTLLFEGNAKSLVQGAQVFAPPVSKYVYGECFTEIDRLTMQFKKHVALLLFEDSIVICKRKWMRYASTKVKDVIKFSSNSNERCESQEQISGKRQGSMSGISYKSADSRGSEGEQRTRSTMDQSSEKQRGYFTKWKHQATYPLSQVEALDMASPVPSASTFYPFAAPATATSGTFDIGRHQRESDDTSSLYTTASIPSYMHQTTSTIELVITSIIDGREYTERLLYLPPSQEVRHQWHSKFNRIKEQHQSHSRTALKGRGERLYQLSLNVPIADDLRRPKTYLQRIIGSADNLVLKDTLSPRLAHPNHSTMSLHSPTSARFHLEGNSVAIPGRCDRTKAFNETRMHPELTFQLDDASGTERLAGGSINGCIHEIVHGNMENVYQDLIPVFARTYPLFTTLSHILKELRRCIHLQPPMASNANMEKMTQRVEFLIKEILKGLNVRFVESSTLEEMKMFAVEILQDKLGSAAASGILKTVAAIMEGQDDGSKSLFAESPASSIRSTEVPVDLSNVLITGLTPALFLRLEASYFAGQVLCYHREQLFIAGGPLALFSNPAFFMRQYPTAGTSRSIQSPLVFSMYSPHFLTVLITHHILIATQSMQSTSRRPKLLTHWIQTAQCSRALGDLAGFVAIAIGICSPGVVRLQESWKHVPLYLRLEVAQTWVPLLIKLDMITEDLQELAISSFDLRSSLNTVIDLSLKDKNTIVPCVCNIKQSIDQVDRAIPSFIQSIPVPILNIEKLEHIHAILCKAAESLPNDPLALNALSFSSENSHLQQYFGHLASISQTLHDQYHSNELANDAFESSLACEPHFNGQYLDYHYKNRKLTGSFIPLIFPEVILEKRLFPLHLLLSLEITGNTHRKSSFDEAQPPAQSLRADSTKHTLGMTTPMAHGSTDWTDSSITRHGTMGPGPTGLSSGFPKSRKRTYSFPPARAAAQGSRSYSVHPMVNMINPHLDAVASGCLLSNDESESNGVFVAMQHVAGIGYSTIAIEDGNLVLKVKEENLEALVKAVMLEEEEEGKSSAHRNTGNNRESTRSSLAIICGPRPVMVKAGTLDNLIHVVVMGLEDQSGRYMNEKGDMIAWTNRQLTLDHEQFMKAFFATYRSYCTASCLLDQLVSMFLFAQNTGSRVSIIPSGLDLFSPSRNTTSGSPRASTGPSTCEAFDWKPILTMQLNVLNTLEFWLCAHVRDFLDDLVLKAKLGEALNRISTQEVMQRQLIDGTLSDKVQALRESLSRVQRLTVQQMMRPFDALNLGPDTIEAFFGHPPSMAPQLEDDWSADHILVQLNTAAWAHFLSVTEHEWFILFEVLESQSADPLGWFLPRQSTTSSDEDILITGIHNTLYTIRRNGAPGTHWNGERLMNSLPMCIQNLCRLHHIIRSWVITQIASPSISYDLRLDRMQKILEIVLQSRRAMSQFGEDPPKPPRATGAGSGRGSEVGVPSFVEEAIVSALVSPESRAYSRAWVELASGQKGSVDALEHVLALQREREILMAGSSGLKTSQELVPAVGWLIERMLETCCYVRDMSYESPMLVNFDKRQYIYDLVQLYVRRQEQLRAMEKKTTLLSSWLGLSTVPSLNLAIKVVRETAQREAISQRSDSIGQLSSVGNHSGRSSRPVKIFSRLIALQHEKEKRDQKEYEKLEKEIKDTQGRIQKAQQEQAKNLEKQIKLEQSRSRVKNQLLKSTLMRAMRPISLAITHSWSTATTTVSNATALGSAISGRTMGGTTASGTADVFGVSGRHWSDTHHHQVQQRPTSFSGSIYHATNPKPVLVINLINSTCSVAYTYTKRDFVFKIVTEEGGQSLLQGLDHEDMHRWIKTLNDAAAEATAKRRTLLDNDESLENVSKAEAGEQGDDIPITEETERKGRNSVFGVELRHLMNDGNIPLIVEKCIAEIEKRGLEEVGIYRVPGSVSAINKLRQCFNSGSGNVDLDSDEWKDINVVAGALKQFLRELPEAVMTSALYDSLVAASALGDYDERLLTMKDLIRSLPPPNYLLLKRIVEHLERVTDFEETNHMYAANLAIVFGPTLLRPGGSSANSFATSMKNLGHQQNIVRNMILQYHWLFDVEEEDGGENAEEDDEGPSEFPDIVEGSDENDYESDEEVEEDDDGKNRVRAAEENEGNNYDEDDKILVLSASMTSAAIDVKEADKDKEQSTKNLRRKTIVFG
ncbi:rho GTPase-activating protein [Modicella reniformis]|uniref:Rho GTPase-activating protein n=1 Tax=Modicella reniformis TaxID=1440133 RepID=A0A9P6SN87_9FUNG|nr:rho GTPase-activating protein [Modicella reniformis]